MKVLITGGTGFIGKRLIPALVGKGHEVYALTRSESSHNNLRAMGAFPVTGDLDGDGPISLPAVDAVVHAAAHFRLARPRAPYLRTNVKATTKLLKAAQEAGTTSFVHVSSCAVTMDDRGPP